MVDDYDYVYKKPKPIKAFFEEVDNIYNKIQNPKKYKWSDKELDYIDQLNFESFTIVTDIETRRIMNDIFDEIYVFYRTRRLPPFEHKRS
jgi:hypothetical protein